jgi:hypothetical protein
MNYVFNVRSKPDTYFKKYRYHKDGYNYSVNSLDDLIK